MVVVNSAGWLSAEVAQGVSAISRLCLVVAIAALGLKTSFEQLAKAGCEVLVGDPGRSYRPTARLEPLATYMVPVTRVLEDAEIKKTTVWRFV